MKNASEKPRGKLNELKKTTNRKTPEITQPPESLARFSGIQLKRHQDLGRILHAVAKQERIGGSENAPDTGATWFS